MLEKKLARSNADGVLCGGEGRLFPLAPPPPFFAISVFVENYGNDSIIDSLWVVT